MLYHFQNDHQAALELTWGEKVIIVLYILAQIWDCAN